MTDGSPIRVFLLDDHDIVLRGLIDLLESQPDLTVVGQATSAASALKAAGACNPDVAVLDVRLGDGNGIEVCRDIRSAYPEIACLILTSFADDHAIIDAAMAGAAGYVLKQIGGNDIVTAIRKVATGAQLLDAAIVRLTLRRLRQSEEGRVDALSEQEHRIFELIGDGYSNRQIAEEMHLAEKTVKNYISNLFVKLGIDRRTQAAAMAARIEERERNRLN
ncbi:MAG: response regulator transcription factor [Acidimicrobiia bacterium]|nr:response regulator transcription factor [Acidimicrobiia bacterium]MDH5519592.1 response regulator transcription factor [Acidimicrobiia bacterium]